MDLHLRSLRLSAIYYLSTRMLQQYSTLQVSTISIVGIQLPGNTLMYCLSLLLSQNIVKILSIFSKYHKEVAVLLILVSLSNFYLIHKFLFGNFRISKNTCAQSLLLSDPNQLVYPIHSLDLNLMILGFAFLELLFSLPRNYDTS